MTTNTVENRQQWVPQRNTKLQAFHPSSSRWEHLKLNCAFTHKRFWILIYWKMVRCYAKCSFLFFSSKSFLFHLLLQTASFRLQTWPSCQELHSHPVWCYWPPWWASLPPLGSPHWAWLFLERWWCGAAEDGQRAQLNRAFLSSQYFQAANLVATQLLGLDY